MSGSSTDSQSLVAHRSVAALSGYLTAHGVEHEIVEHASAFTAAGEARAAGIPPDEAAKTVVLEDRGAYMLALVPASERLDLRKVRSLLGATKSLRLATESEIGTHFAQFELGAVPPMGDVVFAGEVVDRRLAEHSRVMCSAGDHRHSVLVDPADVIRLTGAKLADISED